MAEKNNARSRRLSALAAPKFLDAVEGAIAAGTQFSPVEWAQIVLALHRTSNRLD